MSIATSMCEGGYSDHAAVNVRIGTPLLDGIDIAAARWGVSRNAWVRDTLHDALKGWIDIRSEWLPVSFLELTSHRVPVVLRLPPDLLEEIDAAAQMEGGDSYHLDHGGDPRALRKDTIQPALALIGHLEQQR